MRLPRQLALAQWPCVPRRAVSAARCLVALTLLAAWFSAAWQAVQAQAGISVVETSPPVFEFGQSVELRLVARSAEPITRIEIYWQTPEAPASRWPAVSFVPGREIEARASIDLANYPLPPFATIHYWWVLEAATGSTLTTETATFDYVDNRFSWQRRTSGALTVHWYSGDEGFGQAALAAATNALPRINRDIRAPLPEHVDLYLYATEADIKAALQRVGRAWADGHADPKLGVIIAVVPADLRSDFVLQSKVPHEMTHVLLYRATGENFDSVPIWLNEGLAVMNQGQRDSQYPTLLANARDTRGFLSLAELCGALPAEAEPARLAYAQSDSVVRYLRGRFGSEGLHRLIKAYAGGASCDAGLQTSLGLSLAELQADWLREAIYGNEAGTWTSTAPWLVIAGLVLMTPLLWLIAIARRAVGVRAAPDSRLV